MSASKQAHESASYHVTGQAKYIDDMPMQGGLHGLIYTSPHAHANIQHYDLSKAQAMPGVYAVLSHQDIKGENNVGPVIHDEPTLAVDTVNCVGQAIFLIAADTPAAARAAAEAIEIEYELLPATLTLKEAIENGELLHPARKIARGDLSEGFAASEHTLEGSLTTGAQEHWYLETQVALCVPGEGDEMKVYSSTQHPSETQALVAEALDVPKMEVNVVLRRMGGAFGGKETQANNVAVCAALLAQATKKPVKIRLFRDDDQITTGKRHPFQIDYKVGFDSAGNIHAIDCTLHANAGWSTDLTMAVLERGMMHADNSYYIPHMQIKGKAWKTNTASNTAFRGFGGPQGVAGMEEIIDRVAHFLNEDGAVVRQRNFYGTDTKNLTPYDQKVENNHLQKLFDELTEDADYENRRKAIDGFNARNRFMKKGMALTPVKFGISFTTSFLNQAGALVNVYKDGSITVNHGGTEMGQGLHTKIRGIAAKEFGVTEQRIKVTATDTSKVPNTSATAASAGTDLNGMAVKNAIDTIKARLFAFAADYFSGNFDGEPSLEKNLVLAEDVLSDSLHPDRCLSFEALVMQCYLNQISLSSTGFYRTPDIHFDREKGKGKPYHYFAFGMAITEVLLDTLTGHVQIERADILHDVGDSVNERIDIGQVEGAYMQGVGWCTTEDCKWNDEGHLLNHSPDTYKIPSINDMPKVFNVALLKGVPNPDTIRKSKAVAEPPFMHGLSCWLAVKDAISAVCGHQIAPKLNIPATNEAILLSLDAILQSQKTVAQQEA